MRNVSEKWFKVPLPDGNILDINPDDYDCAFNIEPGFNVKGFKNTNPVIIKNLDEILSRADARERLKVPKGKKLCVVAHNGYPGEMKKPIKG